MKNSKIPPSQTVRKYIKEANVIYKETVIGGYMGTPIEYAKNVIIQLDG